jgi:choline-sulfatase
VAKPGSSLRWIVMAAALAAIAGAIWMVETRGLTPISESPLETAHPSILLVTIDTLRADHCSAYGYPQPTTPRLDAIAKRGVRLATAYAPIATTAPSHATMFTSLLPRAHGLLKNGQALAPQHRRLAEVLRDNGYKTAAFVSSFAVDARFGFGPGFAAYQDDFAGAHASSAMQDWEGQLAPAVFERRADETRALVVDWLRSHGYLDAARVSAPFFVWVHFMDPHHPYSPPHEERAKIEVAPPGEGLQLAIADYDAEVRFADREMGAIFDALESAGRFDQVVTVVVGDHGEGLKQHGHMFHGLTIYEETVRVPFVFHWPWGLREPRVIEPPVQIVDLAPTVLELAGIPPESSFQGMTLAPILRGQGDADPERPVFLERRLYETPVVQGFRVAGAKLGLRQGRWKYIEARDEETYELYDLASDPGEQKNLFESERARAEELARVLHAWADGPAATPAPPVSPEDAERLRELGYVQ